MRGTRFSTNLPISTAFSLCLCARRLSVSAPVRRLPERGEGGLLRVHVPLAEVPALLRGLLAEGVEVLEARRESDDLEGAYLRLLHEDGRPS